MSRLKRALQKAVNASWSLAHGKNAQVSQRNFAAAQATRLLSSWARDGQSINAQLKLELRPLRTRSRDLCNNNDYAKGFLTELKSNVIGPQGVRLQARARSSDGTLDNLDNQAIEASWKKSGKAGEWEASRRFSRSTFERLLIEVVARDGEALVEILPGFENASHFAVKMHDADYLDESYTTEKDRVTGNRVRMGVEIDEHGAPLAYHLRTEHPGERHQAASRYTRVRIEAERMLHIFLPMYADQWRGIPWMHASLIGLRDLSGYREAALIAARVGAAKMGFLSSPSGDGYTGDGKDAAGNTIMDAEAGTFDQVAEGTTLLDWNPQYPHGDFEPFNKAILRGISSGLGLSYHKLSRDLEGVNYSSGRLGELSDRDVWMMLQDFLIGQFHDKVYPQWLRMQLATSNIVNAAGVALPPGQFTKFTQIEWQPRRWQWVDPQKELNARKTAVGEAFKSRSQVIREDGGDPEETWLEIKRENELLKELGITINSDSNTGEANSDGASSDEE